MMAAAGLRGPALLYYTLQTSKQFSDLFADASAPVFPPPAPRELSKVSDSGACVRNAGMIASDIDGHSAREMRPSALPDDVLVVTGLSPVGVGIGAVDALGGEGEGLAEETSRLLLVRLGLDVGHLDQHFVVLVLRFLATVPARRIGEG